MADEAEKIGGISISASITEEGLEAQLNGLLAKMEAAAQKLSAALTIHPTFAAPTQQQVQQQQRFQPPQQTAREQAAVSFGKRAADANAYNSLYKAIAEAEAKQTKGLKGVSDKVQSTAAAQQTEFVQQVHAQAAQDPLVIAVSTDEAKAQLAAFFAEFKTMVDEAQAGATIKVNVEGTAPAAGGRGGGRGRKNIKGAAAGGGGDEEEEGGLGFQTRMAAFELREGDRFQARVQQQRRSAGQRAFTEQERQRKAEVAATRKQYDSLAALATTYFDDQEKSAGRIEGKSEAQRGLTELSFQAEQANAGTTTPGFAGRQRTPAEIEEFRRSEAQRAAAIGSQGPGRAGGGPAGPSAPPPVDTRAIERARAERRSQLDEESLRSSRGGRTQTEADREQRIQANIERQRASITASGRTGRTESFGLGALFGGAQGAFIEASQRQSSALKELNAAQNAAEPVRRRLAQYDEDLTKAKGPLVETLKKERDAYSSRKEVVPILERETKATKELDAANAGLAKLQGPSSIARNLLAGAAGGAAFGLAMAGIAEAGKIVVPVLQDLTDLTFGYGSKSTAVTSALAQQTEAQKGNVNAVLAQQDATAGLSAQASDYLDSQLKLTTQVKAGAIAQKQASDLFKAAAGTDQGTPQGLNGGFGGLFGTPFLASNFGGGPGFKETTAGNLRQFGGASTSTTGRPGDIAGTLNDVLGSLNPFGTDFGSPGKEIQKRDSAAALAAGDTVGTRNQVDDLNKAQQRAAQSTGQASTATFAYTNNVDEVAQAVDLAKAHNDDFGASMASMGLVVKDASGHIADWTANVQAWSQAAVGQGIPATEELGKLASAQETQREKEAAASVPALRQQFAYERPAFLASTQRQQQFAQFTQQPGQQALGNLASPLLATGTGIVGANAKEQDRINQGLKGANALQTQLNAGYKQGLDILENTYKPELIQNFGAAAGVAFQGILDKVTATGKEIAGLQSGIVNEQANYQVAQYNYQLFIAKRSLSDIGGLVGKNFGAGESYLGSLEKQNLALSRQGQLLQFNLSQRQINFQVALAGFQAPGVTPEERQANVAEAKLEASYAQKQLDIQKQMFGNQVQIVDISNLRQGVDLAKQVALLTQGRQVTIDVKVKTAELERAQTLQQQQVAAAGTYLSAIDAVVNHDFAQMTALETAAGRAMFGASKYAVDAFNNYLGGVIGGLSAFGSYFGGGTPDTLNSKHGHASGALFNTGGGAVGMATIGENDKNETVAILRSPRPMMDFGGGGGAATVNFNGDIYVRNDSDIDEITRKVTTAMGRTASLKGLRSGG